jgi:NADPH:quinone reductase-like Zn-dependent oxidoreductase
VNFAAPISNDSWAQARVESYKSSSRSTRQKWCEHLGPEAATLPIAALTAWNSLRESALLPGQTVVVIGTGGVSLFALQFAQLFGARAIVVSSRSDKLARARSLGASEVIDTAATPDWGEQVRELTGGEGAHVIVEVGGGATLPNSIVALRTGGFIAMVGYLSNPQVSFDMRQLFIGKRARLHGQTVGSRADFEQMNRAIEARRLMPVIDSRFPLERVTAAYERLRSRDTFGKVLVTVAI